MTVQLLQVEPHQKHTTVPATIAIDSASFAALVETAKDGLASTGADAIQFHDVTKPYALKGEAPAGTDIALLPGFACAVPRNRVNLLETPFSLQMNLNVTRAENGDSWSRSSSIGVIRRSCSPPRWQRPKRSTSLRLPTSLRRTLIPRSLSTLRSLA